MRIFVSADKEQREELVSGEDIFLSENLPGTSDYDQYDAFFLLQKTWSDFDFACTDKPVFINEVTDTLAQLGLPANVSRINGWNGFLKRNIWEVAAGKADMMEEIAAAFQKKIIMVRDEPGLVSARVISMIINEAFYAAEEGVSTQEEIDIAMKLGTRYPSGPFAWADKIGLHHIYHLLERLSREEGRYAPAPLLTKYILAEKAAVSS